MPETRASEGPIARIVTLLTRRPTHRPERNRGPSQSPKLAKAHFNGLTPGEAERLAMLIGECGEVIRVASNVLRFGYGSFDMAHLRTNRDQLTFALSDLTSMMDFMGEDHGMIDAAAHRVDFERKLASTQHQDIEEPSPPEPVDYAGLR